MNVTHPPTHRGREYETVTIDTSGYRFRITMNPDLDKPSVHMRLGKFVSIQVNPMEIASFDTDKKQAVQEHFDPFSPEDHSDIVGAHYPLVIGLLATKAAHDHLDPRKTPDMSFLVQHFQLSRAGN